MANRRPRFVSRVAAGHPKGWSRIQSTAGTLVSGGSKVLLGTFVLSNPGIGITVRRCRGILTAVTTTTSGTLDLTLAFGLIVVNDLAIAAGAASIPGPFTDASDDGWFVHQIFLSTGIGSQTGTSNFVEYDSKAMRKVREGFGIAVMVENGGASSAEVMFSTSMLTSLS